jgi:transcription-repair coupling factor (superfamily II helicase)
VDSQSRLLSIYRQDARVQELAHQSPETSAQYQLSGLSGGQESFCLAATVLQRQGPHLVVSRTKEEAAYLHNDLENLLGHRLPIYFLPDSFKQAGKFEEIKQSQVIERTECINQIANPIIPTLLIVTYPEALFEKVVDPRALNKSRISIETNHSLDLNFVFELLTEYGFSRVDFVAAPGEFALRGGILDIFSYANEYPYRIELSDETVESIRIFNPESQLSIRHLSAVSILPNIHTEFAAEEKKSLFEIIPPNTLIWLADLSFLIDRLQDCFDKSQLVKVFEKEDHQQASFAKIFREKAFLYPREILTAVNQFSMIFYQQKSSAEWPGIKPIEFKGLPQPSFNRNFELLIQDLKARQQAGFELFIFSDNPKQLARLEAIFQDLKAHLAFHAVPVAIHQGFIDPEHKILCYSDHQIFERFHRYRVREGFQKDTALTYRLVRELQPGDFVTHIDHGIGRYSGLEKIEINGKSQEVIRLVFKNNDLLYVSIHSLHKISKYIGKEGTEPVLNKIGSDTWANLKRKAKRQVKDIAQELIKLYAARKASKGYAFSPDHYLQTELEASFIYEDTPDQIKSTMEVKFDMEKEYPMDRMICGDVGFGKTEIAVRAAFKAVLDGKQVAVMVPTTILALQHFKTFSDRLREFNIKIDYINRFRSSREKTEILEKLKKGEVEILIGTHALVAEDVQFKDLGLLIIDEEQKFGVSVKEKLRKRKVNVDTLTLTATPIPRTLQFSLLSARDMSVMRTPPPNRQPVHTERIPFDESIIREAIYYEVQRGGQVFFVHNRVASLPELTEMLKEQCPTVEFAMAHGQLEPKRLEQTLLDFIDRKFDVLVSTNIIEMGLDIPNANTMFIHNAHQFGLSDIHQLRGRVGRSNKKAYCYLIAPPASTLTSEARLRLKTIEDFSDLGSGFMVSMRDLDIRGAGNMLGAEQSGFISDIGFDTYQKILDEAIQELKEEDFKELFKEELGRKKEFVRECSIDTDLELLIPDHYIQNIQERLAIYTELDSLSDESSIQSFLTKLQDRFGPVPDQVHVLLEGLRCRWLGKKIGIEKILFKNQNLKCYFLGNPKSSFFESPFFQELLRILASAEYKKEWQLKQSHESLILSRAQVKSIQQVKNYLETLLKTIESRLEIAQAVN